MKILLTGASGFVGSAVMRRLTRERLETKVLIRESSNKLNLDGHGVEICIGDLLDMNSLKSAVEGCDILFHTAADYRIWVPNPKEMMDVNVLGTKNIMTVAANAGVKKIIYTSSVAALGPNNNGDETNEETPSRLHDKIGPYKQSKFLAEAEVLRMHKEQRLPVVVVNPSAPIGPGDVKPTPTGRLVLQAANGQVPAYVDTGLNVVHVDDVAEGHFLALENGKEGEKYILGGENLSLLEILTIIADVSGRKPPSIQLPHNLILPIAYIAEVWAKYISGKEPFANVDSVKMSKKPMYYSSKKAIMELGYRPRPVKEAFIDSIKWFDEHGYIQFLK